MRRPLVYICYGVPKSGSSLAHALSAVIAARGGFDQAPLDLPGAEDRHRRAMFLPDVEAARIDQVLEAARRAGREMVVLKTHAPLSDAVRAALADGTLLVQAICRDPRDIALSMRDAARRGDAWGKTARGDVIETTADARQRVARQIARFRDWATLPGALVLDYERTAFETLATANRIAGHMDIAPAPWRDSFAAKRRFTQFNTGRSLRHLTEMSPEEAADWYARHRDLIDAHGLSTRPRSVWPSRLMTALARLTAGRGGIDVTGSRQDRAPD